MERVCSLINKIYREMLCISRHNGVAYITMGTPEHFQVSAISSTPQYKIVLSWDLLEWITIGDRVRSRSYSNEKIPCPVEGRTPCSFTNFITTPELSGPLYISPDIYHTQITEYLLEKIHK